LGLFLGFGFVSAPRILLVYWGAFRFFNKIAYYLSKKKVGHKNPVIWGKICYRKFPG
jgi:hypothetical protein